MGVAVRSNVSHGGGTLILHIDQCIEAIAGGDLDIRRNPVAEAGLHVRAERRYESLGSRSGDAIAASTEQQREPEAGVTVAEVDVVTVDCCVPKRTAASPA